MRNARGSSRNRWCLVAARNALAGFPLGDGAPPRGDEVSRGERRCDRLIKDRARVRILIAGPPKTGNMWLKCLLSRIYDLDRLKAGERPERSETDDFLAWVDTGGFRDGTIVHQHYYYSSELADKADSLPACLVSIIRDPYDAFVSSYFTLQQPKVQDTPAKRTLASLRGKDLHSDDALQVLRDGGYVNNMIKANEWLQSGRAVVLRYEELHRDPVGTLTTVAARLGPASPEKIEAAVRHCSADAMRQRGKGEAKHVRTAIVGDSHNHLTDAHLAIFRTEPYAQLVEALGYPVR